MSKVHSISSALAASVLLLSAGQASAALTSVSAGPVTILGNDYTVVFNKQTQASTTFNDVFGTASPTLTFTSSADATAAVNAILTAVAPSNFDPFGVPSSGFAGFFVPFVYSANGFNRVGANYLLPSGPAFVLGAPTNNDSYGRNQAFNFSFVTFQAVPEPSVMMMTVAAGAMTLRRRPRA